MNSGGITTLFIHGVNPVFELPKSLGFAEALANVGTVISFATFPDETAVASDYIFPDHHGLESWGYQRVATGADTICAFGRAAGRLAECMIHALHGRCAARRCAIGWRDAAQALPFSDEVEYHPKQLDQPHWAGGWLLRCA